MVRRKFVNIRMPVDLWAGVGAELLPKSGWCSVVRSRWGSSSRAGSRSRDSPGIAMDASILPLRQPAAEDRGASGEERRVSHAGGRRWSSHPVLEAQGDGERSVEEKLALAPREIHIRIRCRPGNLPNRLSFTRGFPRCSWLIESSPGPHSGPAPPVGAASVSLMFCPVPGWSLRPVLRLCPGLLRGELRGLLVQDEVDGPLGEGGGAQHHGLVGLDGVPPVLDVGGVPPQLGFG